MVPHNKYTEIRHYPRMCSNVSHPVVSPPSRACARNESTILSVNVAQFARGCAELLGSRSFCPILFADMLRARARYALHLEKRT